MKTRKKLASYLTYGIILYIAAFIAWWTILLINTEKENYELKTRIVQTNPELLNSQQAQQDFSRDKLMIVLESIVFMVLLLVASYFVLSILKKQERFIGLKRNFLLATTHEFKTPLSAIKLNLQTLEKTALTTNQKDLLINNALKEVNRLNTLTNNILLASKIDADGYEFAKTPINISQLFQKTISQNYPNNHRLKVIVEPNIFILADATALQVILLNLIDNALKYSPSEEEVTAKLLKKDNQAKLSVIDKGIGIPKEEQNNIWQRFYRIEDERTRKTIGTGLGLYLVKTMTEICNGKVKVISNEPKGSIFEITIPVCDE